MLDLEGEQGNEDSVAIAEYWLGRRPEAFTVYRQSGSGKPVGFMTWLQLTTPCEDEMAVDPVVAEAWAHVRKTNPLRDGEHLGIARFMVSRDANPSPTGDLISARILAHVLHADRMAWACVVLADPEKWRKFPYFAEMDPPFAVQVGDRTYGLFHHDWRAVPVEAWLERLDSLSSARGGPERGTPLRQLEKHRLEVLSRGEFDAAVRSALRSWSRPGPLAANPLVRTRLVRDVTGGSPVESLRKVLSEAVATLNDDGREAKLHRALAVTFLRGAPTQEAAAERLGLPFSTYRRHLTRGIERVCDLLWHRELYGSPGAPD